jgi:hypothetical protein
MNVWTVCLLCVAGFASWASAEAPSAAAPATSEGLVAVKSRTLDELYVRPSADLSAYRRIIVDPAHAALAKNWLKDMNSQRDVQRWLRPDDAARIADEAAASLRTVVTETFKTRGYEIATAPGAGVLRLTASATDVFVNAPDVPAPGIQRAFVRDGGQATLRLDVRDSVSGVLVARIVDRGTARELRLNNQATSVSNLFCSKPCSGNGRRTVPPSSKPRGHRRDLPIVPGPGFALLRTRRAVAAVIAGRVTSSGRP